MHAWIYYETYDDPFVCYAALMGINIKPSRTPPGFIPVRVSSNLAIKKMFDGVQGLIGVVPLGG